MSWSVDAIIGNAELPCTCHLREEKNLCSPCFSRFHIMEDMYGARNTGAIAMEFAESARWERMPGNGLVAPTSDDLRDDPVVSEMVKISDGTWVPLVDLEDYVTDEDELMAIIDSLINDDGAYPVSSSESLTNPHELASLERPD